MDALRVKPMLGGRYCALKTNGSSMKPLVNGLLTGLFLQLAIGPVFFYILGITVDSYFINSIAAILAVTIVDYIYITLSIIGLGKLLEKEKIKKIFGIIGSIVLILFGVMILIKGLKTIGTNTKSNSVEWTFIKSFAYSFILTISSPLTIVFWSSIFATKAIEKKYSKQQLIPFGIGAGSATFIFLSIVMLILSLLKKTIPIKVIQWLNAIVGVILIIYGTKRLLEAMKKRKHLTPASTL